MKKKRKVSKNSKRRLVWFGTLALIPIAYLFTILPVYVIRIYNLKQEEATLKENLVALQAKEKNLKTQIEKLKDKEYLAKYARENYQYSKKGELVFKLEEDKQNTDKKHEKINIDTNYIWLIGGVIIFILIVRTFIQMRRKRWYQSITFYIYLE